MEIIRRYSSVFSEFKKFILRGNVVDLAVGVVIGAAFTAVVNSIVTNIINPLLALFAGGHRFDSKHFTIHDSTFTYGAVISSIITFLIVAAVIFFFVVQPINKLNEIATRSKKAEGPSEKKCPFCVSTIPINATRCKYCTSKLETKEAENVA